MVFTKTKDGQTQVRHSAALQVDISLNFNSQMLYHCRTQQYVTLLNWCINLTFHLVIAYGTSKVGVTALSKIQARALTEDSREDILLNAVS